MVDSRYREVDEKQNRPEGIQKGFKEIRFVAPIKPTAKARPRFGNGIVYTPEKTHKYEETVALVYKAEYHDFMFPKGVPLRVVIDFYFKPPKSSMKKNYEAMLGGKIRPVKRSSGDVDNLVKAVLDSGNGVIWPDDSQVVEVVARKFFGVRARAEIYVVEVEDE